MIKIWQSNMAWGIPTGLSGATGVYGETGIQGTTGFQGIQGATGQGIQGIQGTTGTQGIQGPTGIQGSTGLLNITEVSATLSTSTSSGTDILLDSMIFTTPAAGNYECWFSSYCESSNSNGIAVFSIYYGTNQVAPSVRQIELNIPTSIASHTKVTVDGTQNISVRWHHRHHINSGSSTCYERTFTIAKVG